MLSRVASTAARTAARGMCSQRPVGVRAFSVELTEDQKSIQKTARDFAINKMIPKAAHYDKTMEYPREIFNEAWELGLVNTHIPTEYGGLGLHALEGVIIAEELAYGCTGARPPSHSPRVRAKAKRGPHPVSSRPRSLQPWAHADTGWAGRAGLVCPWRRAARVTEN